MSVCINCHECVHACPERLLPHYLYHFVTTGRVESLEAYGVNACTSCGFCDEVCPSELHLQQAIEQGKHLLAPEKDSV